MIRLYYTEVQGETQQDCVFHIIIFGIIAFGYTTTWESKNSLVSCQQNEVSEAGPGVL